MPKQPTKNKNKEDKPFYKNQSKVLTPQGKGTVLRSFEENGEWIYRVMLDDDHIGQIYEMRNMRNNQLSSAPFFADQSKVHTSQGNGTVLRSFKKDGQWMYRVMLNDLTDHHHQILTLPENQVDPLGPEPLRNPYVLDL